HDSLKPLLAAHAKTHANDPLLPFFKGELHAHEGRFALAETEFAAGLAKAPDSDALEPFRASRVLAPYCVGKGLTADRAIGPRADTFRQLAALCLDDHDDALVVTLLDAHSRNDPDSIDVHQYRSRLKIRQKQIAEGVSLFKSLVARKLSDDQRAALLDAFFSDMIEAGHPVEVCRAAPDAKAAYEALVPELFDEGRWDDVRRLNDAYMEAHAADPWLTSYRGSVCLEDKDWKKAV